MVSKAGNYHAWMFIISDFLDSFQTVLIVPLIMFTKLWNIRAIVEQDGNCLNMQ